MLPSDLLYILACPLCKGELTHSEENALCCVPCDCSYPVVEGIPQLLPEHANTAPAAAGNVS